MSTRVTPLRKRMLDDMAMRNMSPNTQKVYTYAIAGFSQFHRKSPDVLGLEDVREYRLHLLARGMKAKSINPIVGALRFFYGTTLGNKSLADQITFARIENSPSRDQRGCVRRRHRRNLSIVRNAKNPNCIGVLLISSV